MEWQPAPLPSKPRLGPSSLSVGIRVLSPDAGFRFWRFAIQRLSEEEEAENGEMTTPEKLAVTYRTVEKCG
jgi:hypothetical protein